MKKKTIPTFTCNYNVILFTLEIGRNIFGNEIDQLCEIRVKAYILFYIFCKTCPHVFQSVE